MRRLVVLFLVTGAILVSWQTADAAPTIFWVDDQGGSYIPPGRACEHYAGYATIQAAVDAASPGDTIKVCPGVYRENVAINKPHLTVISTSGAQVTTIGAAMSSFVVYITQPDVTVDGFTIRPAGFADSDIGVHVAIEGNAGADIAHNIIVRGRIGINLGCSSHASTVYRNIVNGASEAGINVDTCENDPFPGSSYNSVHHNVVCGGLFPYSIALGQGSNYNLVHNNRAIWITAVGVGNQVHYNVAELFDLGTSMASNNIVADVCP